MMKNVARIAVVVFFGLAGCGGDAKPADAPMQSGSSSSNGAADAGAVTCSDKDGKTHAAGERWNDGCNECSCGPNGTAGCTRRACEKP